MRITRKELDHSINLINRSLGRPMTAFTRPEMGGKLKANIGHLHIDSYSPGDGMTRFRLAEMVTEGGGISTIRESFSLGAGDFDSFLKGVLVGIELSKRGS